MISTARDKGSNGAMVNNVLPLTRKMSLTFMDVLLA
jgi:hypothetical protein